MDSDKDIAREPLPVAVVGVGGFGAQTLEALLQSPLVKVVGVSDRSPESAQRVGQNAGVPA